jgi:hypothetical protein
MVASTFEEACARFSRFLSNNAYSDALVWVTPQDILFTDRRLLYVKLPVPKTNLKRVRELFDAAMKEQSGISFSTVCKLDEATCCRAWVPANEDERERAMCPRDLKLSAHLEGSRLAGKAVRSALLWWYLRLRYRKLQTGSDDVFWG